MERMNQKHYSHPIRLSSTSSLPAFKVNGEAWGFLPDYKKFWHVPEYGLHVSSQRHQDSYIPANFRLNISLSALFTLRSSFQTSACVWQPACFQKPFHGTGKTIVLLGTSLPEFHCTIPLAERGMLPPDNQQGKPGTSKGSGRIVCRGYLCILAVPPFANARTCSNVAMLVSPGKVVNNAP